MGITQGEESERKGEIDGEKRKRKREMRKATEERRYILGRDLGEEMERKRRKECRKERM